MTVYIYFDFPSDKKVKNIEDQLLVGNGNTYELYWDDGMTRNCTEENIRVLGRS